jgi:hypothetical protein
MSDEKVAKAQELKAQAEQIADTKGKNPVLMGIIALEFKDPELVVAGGFHTYDQCLTSIFGKKKKTAYRWRAIVERLMVEEFASQEQLLDWGCVKASELARLPESQLRTGEWQASAGTLDSTTFKEKVAGFLADRPDHREEKFFWIHQAMPESFRPVWNAALETAKIMAEQDGETLETKASCIEYICAGFVKAYAPLVHQEEDQDDGA